MNVTFLTKTPYFDKLERIFFYFQRSQKKKGTKYKINTRLVITRSLTSPTSSQALRKLLASFSTFKATSVYTGRYNNRGFAKFIYVYVSIDTYTVTNLAIQLLHEQTITVYFECNYIVLRVIRFYEELRTLIDEDNAGMIT